MRCLKKAIYLLLMLLTLFQSYPQAMLISSEKLCEAVEIEIVDKVYNSKTDYLKVDVIVPQINNLSNKQAEKNINSKITKWTEDWIADVKSIAEEYFKDGTNPLMPYELYARYRIMNNSNISSLYIDYYQFTGGAHGITTRVSYNIDNETGKELQLKDIFKRGYNYKSVINKEINRQILNEKDKYFTGKDGFKGISDTQGFYIDGKNIIVFFGVYEIAPYVTGIPEFYIPIELFDKAYIYDGV